MTLLIRAERPEDRDAIFALHAAAFPADDEARLVDALRDEDSLRISLVATMDDQIVGHIGLSVMQVPARTLGLAPVSTLPAHQRKGIAAALINQAISQAKAEDGQASCVLGDPAYYGRFGFDVARADGFDCPYQGPAFAVLPLTGGWPQADGPAAYAPAFDNL